MRFDPVVDRVVGSKPGLFLRWQDVSEAEKHFRRFRALGAPGFPTTYLIGADEKPVARRAGAMSEGQLRSWLAENGF